MDRLTLQQLDRIEQNQNRIIEMQQYIINNEGIEVLTGFYEEEIQNPDGKLHYLHKDTKLKEFFEQLDKEETTKKKEEEQEEKYTNTPFKK